MNLDFICLVAGLSIGFGVGWFLCWQRQNTQRLIERQQLEIAERRAQSLEVERAKTSERIRLLESNQETVQSELVQERQFNISLHSELSRERTNRNHLEQKLAQQKAEISQLVEKLGREVRHAMQETLDEKLSQFASTQNLEVGSVVGTLTDEIKDLREQLERQISDAAMNLQSSIAAMPSLSPDHAAPLTNGDHRPAVHPGQETAPEVPLTGQEVEFSNFIKRTIGRAKK